MKTNFLKSVLVLFTLTMYLFPAFGQSPEKMSYQAVIRNSSNALVTNTQVGMRVSILQGSVTGTEVYKEIYNPNPQTNANGLVTIEIGGGIPLVGTFATIDWANGPYFIKTETDPTGGTNYTITGTSQLLSVPYALHAKTAETISGGITETDPIFGSSVAHGITGADTTNWNNKLNSYTETDPIFGSSVASGITGADTTNWNNKLDSYTETDPIFGSSVASGITGADTTNWNNKQDQLVAGTNITIVGNTISASGGSATHYVGELYGGGVVFWVDHTGQHGLIVSMIDLSTAQAWSNITDQIIGATAQSDWDGNSNTTAIIGQSGHTSSAASLCADYTNADYGTGTYSDWYLPSRCELIDLWNNLKAVQKALDSDGNGSTNALVKNYYWSSSEYHLNLAWGFYFNYGYSNFDVKSNALYVRAVRAF